MKQVLILEDNRKTREALKKTVEGVGGSLAVYAAASVGEACRMAYRHRIDLFLLDIVLVPGEPTDTSGIRFAARLRETERYRFTPLIFITALSDPKMYAFQHLHSYAYLEKPFRMADLSALVSQALTFPNPDLKARTAYFRKDGALLAVDLRKVLYVETGHRKLDLHLQGETLEIPYLGVTKFLESGETEGFVQCSRFAAVNTGHIKSIDLTRRYLQLKNGTRLEIGEAYRDRLRQDIHLFGAVPKW